MVNAEKSVTVCVCVCVCVKRTSCIVAGFMIWENFILMGVDEKKMVNDAPGLEVLDEINHV